LDASLNCESENRLIVESKEDSVKEYDFEGEDV
jgi:hypothetical protein